MSNQRMSSATTALIDELKLTLEADLSAIGGEWDGDEPGELEDRAHTAEEALNTWDYLTELLEELA